MTYSIPSQTHTARVMLAVFLLTGAAGISVQAAASTGGDCKRSAGDGD